jgi:hypothetical protein
MPGPVERALAKHRNYVRDVLITLFEKSIPEADVVSREVVTRVLGKTVDWTKAVTDIATNPHLKDLVRPGVSPIVWETKDRKGSFARSVLDPITVAGQECLLDFLGTLHKIICDDTLSYTLIYFDILIRFSYI